MKKSALYLLLITFIGLSACQKSNEPNVAPTASITGTIAPLSLAFSIIITATNTQTNASVNARPDSSGVFKFSALPPGSYQVTFNAVPTNTPPIISLTLVAGKVADLGTLTFPNTAPISGTGIITGVVNPAGAVSNVSATRKNSTEYFTTAVNTSGAFTFKELSAGSYMIYMTYTFGYTPAGNTSFNVTVENGKTVNIGTVLFYDDSDPASPNYLSYDVDGAQHRRRPQFGSTYVSPNFRLYNRSVLPQGVGGPLKPQDRVAYEFEIKLDAVIGPGTYICTGTAASTIRISMRSTGGSPLHTWSTMGADGTGTVTITSIDTAKRTMSGSFTAKTVPESSGATGNKVITNGVFANFKY